MKSIVSHRVPSVSALAPLLLVCCVLGGGVIAPGLSHAEVLNCQIAAQPDSHQPDAHQTDAAQPEAHSGTAGPAAWLGAGTYPVSPVLSEQLGLPRGEGLVVGHVHDPSPARAAGLTRHDILHKIDDTILTSPRQLDAIVRGGEPGKAVALTVVRRGETRVLEATLGTVPRAAAPDAAAAPVVKKSVPFLGIASGVVPEAVAAQIDLAEGQGVIVLAVMADSPAAKAGIQRNDVLVKLGDTPVTGPRNCRHVVRGRPTDQPIALHIIRDGKPLQLQATLTQREVIDRGPERIAAERLVEIDPRDLEDGQIDNLDPDDPEDAQRIKELLEARQARFNARRQRIKMLVEQNPDGIRIRPQGDPQVEIAPLHIPADVARGGVSVTSMADNEHALTITRSRDGTHLLARDKSGKVLYEGPIDTPEQIESLPPAVRKKVQWMQKPLNEQMRELPDHGGEKDPMTPPQDSPMPV